MHFVKNACKAILLFTGLALLSSCSPEPKSPQTDINPLNSLGLLHRMQSAKIQIVLNDGSPLAGAQVLIGEEIDQPFPNNLLTTDQDGYFYVPAAWTKALPLTVSSKLAVRTTFLEQLPRQSRYMLRPAFINKRLELSGQTSGFKVTNGDDLADFALSMPALQKQDLVNFSLNTIISPETDKVSAAGRSVKMPSNASLPKQRENYLIPITLEKSKYRMYFPQEGPQKILTLRGQFPFKEVIDAFRKDADFADLINLFSIHGGSLLDTSISGPKNQLDLPVGEFSFAGKEIAHSPSINSDELVVLAALAEKGQYLIPTDLKRLGSNQKTTLSTLANERSQLLSILKKEKEFNKVSKRVSAALTPFGSSARLLALIEDPVPVEWNRLQMQQIAKPAQLAFSATLAKLSRITLQKTASGEVEIEESLWEVYGFDWTSTLNLPLLNETKPQGKLRWTFSFLGSESNSMLPIGPQMLDAVTHATTSAIDF